MATLAQTDGVSARPDDDKTNVRLDADVEDLSDSEVTAELQLHGVETKVRSARQRKALLKTVRMTLVAEANEEMDKAEEKKASSQHPADAKAQAERAASAIASVNTASSVVPGLGDQTFPTSSALSQMASSAVSSPQATANQLAAMAWLSSRARDQRGSATPRSRSPAPRRVAFVPALPVMASAFRTPGAAAGRTQSPADHERAQSPGPDQHDVTDMGGHASTVFHLASLAGSFSKLVEGRKWVTNAEREAKLLAQALDLLLTPQHGMAAISALHPGIQFCLTRLAALQFGDQTGKWHLVELMNATPSGMPWVDLEAMKGLDAMSKALRPDSKSSAPAATATGNPVRNSGKSGDQGRGRQKSGRRQRGRERSRSRDSEQVAKREASPKPAVDAEPAKERSGTGKASATRR